MTDFDGCAPGQMLVRHELPVVSVTQLAYYCAAVGVTDPIHYDRDAATAAGFMRIPVNGSLRIAWIAEALEQLADGGELIELRCRHTGPVFVGDREVIEARFAATSDADDGARITCEVTGTVDGKTVDAATALVRVGGKH